MIRPPRVALALWRSVTEASADRNREQEADCPISDYTKAIQSNPNDATAYLGLGMAHLKAFDFDNAIADFTKVIELNPNHAPLTPIGGAPTMKKLSSRVPLPTSPRLLRWTRNRHSPIATWVGHTKRWATKKRPSPTIGRRLRSTPLWKRQEITSSSWATPEPKKAKEMKG
jgi:tetratricopeptide (TPR) repeat protein